MFCVIWSALLRDHRSNYLEWLLADNYRWPIDWSTLSGCLSKPRRTGRTMAPRLTQTKQQMRATRDVTRGMWKKQQQQKGCMTECLFEKKACEDWEHNAKRVCGLMKRSQNSSAIMLHAIKHDILTVSHWVVGFAAAATWTLTMNGAKYRQILKKNLVERPNIRGMFALKTHSQCTRGIKVLSPHS